MQCCIVDNVPVCAGLSEPVRERWQQCVSGCLADINKLNTIEMVSFVVIFLIKYGTFCNVDSQIFAMYAVCPSSCLLKHCLHFLAPVNLIVVVEMMVKWQCVYSQSCYDLVVSVQLTSLHDIYIVCQCTLFSILFALFLSSI